MAAVAGYEVVMLIDIKEDYIQKGMETINFSLGKLVIKERMTVADADSAIGGISTGTDETSALIAIWSLRPFPSSIEGEIFSELDGICGPETILASNTSSISISNYRWFNEPTGQGHRYALHESSSHHETRRNHQCGDGTSVGTNQAVVEAAEKMGKNRPCRATTPRALSPTAFSAR